MATHTHNSTAVAYAQALLELAQPKNQAESIGQELASIGEILQENPMFLTFLRDPAISREDRVRVVDKTLRANVSPLLANFLGVLGNHNRLGLLNSVVQAYDELLDELLGKVEVDVTVSQKLSSEELEQVRQKVSAALKKDAVVHQYVDDSIIGGMILRVGDQLIDASVRTQLESMKRKFLASRPR